MPIQSPFEGIYLILEPAAVRNGGTSEVNAPKEGKNEQKYENFHANSPENWDLMGFTP